ncbi:MAG: transcriptional regulator, partial [Betaproteobacteria bacterium]
SHIEAMGGELEVVARFPEGIVRISNFSELA